MDLSSSKMSYCPELYFPALLNTAQPQHTHLHNPCSIQPKLTHPLHLNSIHHNLLIHSILCLFHTAPDHSFTLLHHYSVQPQLILPVLLTPTQCLQPNSRTLYSLHLLNTPSTHSSTPPHSVKSKLFILLTPNQYS